MGQKGNIFTITLKSYLEHGLSVFQQWEKKGQGSVLPHAFNEENSRIHISQSSGWHFKLFCLSESLLVFVPYGQTLCTAFIFPGRGEKHNVPALFLLSICTDEQNNSDKKAKRKKETKFFLK